MYLPDWEDFLLEIGELDEAIERVEEEVDNPPITFIESVREKSIGISETVQRNEEVTDKQVNAIRNMLEGVCKWLPSNT